MGIETGSQENTSIIYAPKRFPNRKPECRKQKLSAKTQHLQAVEIEKDFSQSLGAQSSGKGLSPSAHTKPK